MQKHPHETIFTAHEQFLFLFDRTEPIYIGKNNHDAYRKSKLDEVLYSPDLSELNSNPAKYDIIYLTDYSEVHISLEQYRKICVPPKQRSLIFYIGDLVTSLHLQKILSTPKDLSAFEHCATWYYVRA